MTELSPIRLSPFRRVAVLFVADPTCRRFDRIPKNDAWLVFSRRRYFTWDAQKFPHSVDMIDRVAAKGRKMVTIVDPHIKHDDNYHVHKEAKDKGYYVKDKHSNNYEGWCWPGAVLSRAKIISIE